MPMPIKAVIGAIESSKTPKALKEALKKKYAKQIAQYKGNISKDNPSKEVDWYKYWTHVQPKLRSEILNFIRDLVNEGYSKKRIEIELIDTYNLDSQFVKWLIKYAYNLKL